MQVSVENTGSLGRKLTVQVPSSEIEEKVTSRLRELGKNMKLKGFRPGRVPFSVVSKRYGPQVRQEVMGELIQHSFAEAVSAEKLRPAGMPEIVAEPPEADADLQFTAAFDVFPELASVDVSKLALERPVAEVTDGDVGEMLQTLRKQRQTWVDVDREAADEDLVFFHFTVELEDGRFPAEGEERAGAILGHGLLGESFEQGLVGAKPGDERSFDVDFPAVFRNKEIAGKSGKANVRVEKVQVAELPELDESFAAAFGVAGGLEELRQGVQENLERELKQGISRKSREETIQKLREAYPDIEIPKTLINNEISALQSQAKQQAEQAGQPDAPMPAAEVFADAAQRRVHAAVLISEIARHAGIELNEQRVREAIAEIASTYEDPQSVVNLYLSDQRLLSPVQNLILEEQAVDWVLENAMVSDVPMSFADVMAPQND